METYRHRIEGTTKTGGEAEQLRKEDGIERALRLAGIRAERNEIYSLGRSGKISDEVVRKLVREADLLEARYISGLARGFTP